MVNTPGTQHIPLDHQDQKPWQIPTQVLEEHELGALKIHIIVFAFIKQSRLLKNVTFNSQPASATALYGQPGANTVRSRYETWLC